MLYKCFFSKNILLNVLCNLVIHKMIKKLNSIIDLDNKN